VPTPSLSQTQQVVDSGSAWACQLLANAPTTVDDVVDDASTAGLAAVEEAKDFTLWDAHLWYEIKNELKQLMMHDRITVRFRKSVRDGSFSAPHLVYPSQCDTGSGMFPRTVVTSSCWYEIGVIGRETLSFVTGVAFWDQLGGLSFNKVRLNDQVIIHADGSYEHVGGFQPAGGGSFVPTPCATAFGAPPTWDVQCDLKVYQVASL
jgi:hypothetical protein